MARARFGLLLLLAACGGGGNRSWPGLGGGEGSMTCGDGTYLAGGECLVAAAISCGAGTYQSGSTCLPGQTVSCGAGTHLSGQACVPDAGTTCGTGTHLSGSSCLPDAVVTCGAGTHASGGACLPDPGLTCGTGTHLDGTVCRPDAVITCGAGAHLDGSRCVADATTTFEIRVGSAALPADGFSKVPVLVIGRNADGTPSQAAVILWTSRPGAGAFSPAQATLGALGTLAYFTPCSSASVGCTGEVALQVSLAGNPTVTVATTGPIQLVAPTGIGSSAACLGGGNALFFDGNDYIFSGTQLVTRGVFSPAASDTEIRFTVTPTEAAQGLWWWLTFSSATLGQPLAAQVYQGATRWPFQGPGVPGLDVSGDGRGCNTLSGAFQIEELVRDAAGLSRLTATFEQHCENGATALRGCLHYER